MLAMDGQWRSARIVSVRTNRVLNKHYERSIYTLIKTEIGPWHMIYIYMYHYKILYC